MEGCPLPVETLSKVSRLAQSARGGGLRLSYNIADSPRAQAVVDIFLSQPHLCALKVFGVGGLVQANLHGHLHHGAAEDKGGVGDGALCRERPGTEQAQGLDDMVVGLVPDRVPDQIAQWLREVLQERRARDEAARGHGDDGPEQQLVVLGVVLVGGAQLVEEGQEGVVELEVLGEQLVDVAVAEAHLAGAQGEEHGRAAAQVQQRGGGDLLMLRLQECVVLQLGRGEVVAVGDSARGAQHGLAGGLLALVQGQAVAQILHLLLHLGVAVALADALEVGLDDTSQVLLLAAGAAHEGVLLDVALELPKTTPVSRVERWTCGRGPSRARRGGAGHGMPCTGRAERTPACTSAGGLPFAGGTRCTPA